MKKLNLLVLAIAVVVASCSGATEVVDSVPPDTQSPTAPPVTQAPTAEEATEAPTTTLQVLEIATGRTAFAELANWIIRENATLATLELGDVTNRQESEGAFEFTLAATVIESHWSPIGVDGPLVGEAIVIDGALFSDDLEWLLASKGDLIHAIVTGERRLGEFTPVDPAQRIQHNRYDLGNMIEDAATVALWPDRSPFACGPPKGPPDAAPGVESLAAHFADTEAIRNMPIFNAVADQIAQDIVLTDSVTGEAVDADVNDIERQLYAGVAPQDVVIPPVVQVGLDTTSFSGEPSYLVFVSSDEEILGWTAISRPEEVVLMEVRIPVSGARLDIYHFPGDAFPNVVCRDEWNDRGSLLMSVPFQDVFGDARATIDLGDLTHRDLLKDLDA